LQAAATAAMESSAEEYAIQQSIAAQASIIHSEKQSGRAHHPHMMQDQ
jgi:hypothetical protein